MFQIEILRIQTKKMLYIQKYQVFFIRMLFYQLGNEEEKFDVIEYGDLLNLNENNLCPGKINP